LYSFVNGTQGVDNVGSSLSPGEGIGTLLPQMISNVTSYESAENTFVQSFDETAFPNIQNAILMRQQANKIGGELSDWNDIWNISVGNFFKLNDEIFRVENVLGRFFPGRTSLLSPTFQNRFRIRLSVARGQVDEDGIPTPAQVHGQFSRAQIGAFYDINYGDGNLYFYQPSASKWLQVATASDGHITPNNT